MPYFHNGIKRAVSSEVSFNFVIATESFWWNSCELLRDLNPYYFRSNFISKQNIKVMISFWIVKN